MKPITFGQLWEAGIIYSHSEFYLMLNYKVVLDNVITRPCLDDKYTEYFDYPVSGIYPEQKKGKKCLKIVIYNKEN